MSKRKAWRPECAREGPPAAISQADAERELLLRSREHLVAKLQALKREEAELRALLPHDHPRASFVPPVAEHVGAELSAEQQHSADKDSDENDDDVFDMNDAKDTFRLRAFYGAAPAEASAVAEACVEVSAAAAAGGPAEGAVAAEGAFAAEASASASPLASPVGRARLPFTSWHAWKTLYSHHRHLHHHLHHQQHQLCRQNHARPGRRRRRRGAEATSTLRPSARPYSTRL